MRITHTTFEDAVRVWDAGEEPSWATRRGVDDVSHVIFVPRQASAHAVAEFDAMRAAWEATYGAGSVVQYPCNRDGFVYFAKHS
jgi:hypothetical protein